MISFSFFKIYKNRTQWILVILCLITIISCDEKKGVKYQDRSGSVELISIAQRIAIEKFSDYTKITIINPWQGADNVNMEYYLVRRGSDLPRNIDSLRVIRVPVRKIVCMSTTHVAMISALGKENTIAGMSGTSFIFSGELKAMAEKGLVSDVGYEANLNKELILKILPDITMIYGVGSESSGYVGKIEELGIRVIYNADYLETDPLGKAEWIKLFGVLYCLESKADSIFTTEAEAYNSLKSYVAGNIKSRPEVLLGLPFKDTWFVSPGNSFVSRMIADAGGEYLWKDTESTVSMPYGLENVYLKAVKADYWLNIGTVKTKNDIPAVDRRLTELPCFRGGKLYNNNNRITAEGGNDFWESGTVYPHIILNDIASILHPELFHDYKLYFYRRID